MGSRVQYRDLPGGPAELKFCDELTRHCLCTNCNMLSMSMLQDTNRHMFCETCLTETSEKHHREHIYCKHENKEVSIFEMFDAHALITVIRDQYVMCPYQDCKDVVTLVQLKDHYMARHPIVTCSTCKRQVQTAEWSNHSKDCRERGAYKTPPKAAIPKQGNHNGASQRKDAILSPNSTQSAKMDGYQNSGDTFRPTYPSSELQQAQKPTNDGSDKIVLCQHCEKKVKEKNMPQHLKACTRAPQPCVYCDEKFSKEKIKSHLAVCKANPDNIREQAQDRNREVPNPRAVRPSEAQVGQPASYAAALKGEKRPGGNMSPSAPPRSVGTQQEATRQVGPASAKGASKSCQVSKKGELPADSPVWLQYLSSGDLLAAFAAFQESFLGKNKDDNFLYTEFTTKFVDASCHEMVKDLLEEPCRTQPLDCLIVALFARASLPPKVWTKSIHDVTWKDVLKYLPFVLVSGLKTRKVMAYLRRFPVFLDEGFTSTVVETSSGTEEHPHKDSHCRNLTNQAARASNVEDPPVNAKDKPDASDLVKDNNMDGGKPPGEEKSSLHSGQKSSQQPVAKVEVEITEREKCRDGEKRPQRGLKTPGKKAGASPSRSIEYTQKEPTSDQIQPASDQAGFATTPSWFDTETPGVKDGVNIFNPPQSTACQLNPTHEQKSLEELGALLFLEGHPKPDVKSLKFNTCGMDAISLDSADVGDFSHTAANKGTAPKAESYCTSLDNSSSKEGKKLTSELQSQNDHAPNVTFEDSQLSTGQGGSLRSAAKGAMQTDHFYNSARAVYSIEAEVLHGDRHDSTGRKTQSANNKPLLEHEHQTGNGHSESIGPEKAPESTKCKTCPSEATPSGSADENNFISAATNVEKAPEAGNTSTSVGDRALREDREFLAAQRQFRSDHASNVTCKGRELSTRLMANFSSSAERTMQAHDFTKAPHIASSTRADALPVQKIGSTDQETPLKKKERFWELTLQARTVPKESFMSDSAPYTANDMFQYSRCEVTNTGRVSAIRAALEPSPPEPQCLQTRSESVGSINKVTAKEEMSSDAENEQHVTGSKPYLDDNIVLKLSHLSISHESCDERTTPTSDQSTYSQLRKGMPFQGEHYQAGGGQTEASAPPESHEESLRCDTRCCSHGRSNSDCWATWV